MAPSSPRTIDRRRVRAAGRRALRATRRAQFEISLRTSRGGRSRRTHLYAVGPPRSGTTFLAQLFSLNGYRSDHEPLQLDYLRRTNRQPSWVGTKSFNRYIARRDRWLNLEFEASYFMFEAIEALANEFDDVSFICTVRDCYSWLESVINREFGQERADLPARSWNQRFVSGSHTRDLVGPDGKSWTPDWKVLARYLDYWDHHYRTVLEHAPGDRTVFVRTADLSRSKDALAAQIGCELPLAPPSSVNATSRRSVRLLDYDVEPLQRLARTRCGETMEHFFPELDHPGEVLE